MAVQLKPRKYKQNLSWKMLPKNKVDTVAFKPIVNTLLSPSVVHTEEITSVLLNDQTVSLPIADSTSVTDEALTVNNDGTDTLAYGAVQVVMASGSFTYRPESPLPFPPFVFLQFEGNTKYVNRNAKTFNQMYSLFNVPNIAPIISSNASGNEDWTGSKSQDTTNRGSLDDATLVDYSKSSIPLFPFVKTVRAAGSGPDDFLRNKLTEEEVLTHWIDSHDYIGLDVPISAATEDWAYLSSSSAWLTWDSRAPRNPNIHVFNSQRASFVNRNLAITTEVIKVSDYEYTINWKAPVRYAYAACAQSYALHAGTFPATRVHYDIDSYAFLDRITKVVLKIAAQEMNTETIDMGYSITSSNQIVTDLINEHPITFDKNEFITLQSTINNVPWTLQMAVSILVNYKNGKYIVEGDVYAQWAIENNVHVNTEVQIMLQNGEYIKRGSSITTFKVKNIEKSFKNNEFVYSLKLLEV